MLHNYHNTAKLPRTDANSSSINSIDADAEDDHLHFHDCCHPSYLLQQSILKSVSNLKTKRPGSIIISSAVSFPTIPRVPSDYIFMDICNKNTMGNALYFSPKYTLDDVGRGTLLQDIMKASLQGGDQLYSNGKGRKKAMINNGGVCRSQYDTYYCVARVQCSHSRIYQGKKVFRGVVVVPTEANYRQSQLSNDRKNNRAPDPGNKLLKRTDISRPLCNNEACPFNFTIFSDQSGYFIKPWQGCFYHAGHAKMDHLRPKVGSMSDIETQLVKDMQSARAAPGHAVNLHYARTSRSGSPNLISTNQVKHIMRTSSIASGQNGEEVYGSNM